MREALILEQANILIPNRYKQQAFDAAHNLYPEYQHLTSLEDILKLEGFAPEQEEATATNEPGLGIIYYEDENSNERLPTLWAALAPYIYPLELPSAYGFLIWSEDVPCGRKFLWSFTEQGIKEYEDQNGWEYTPEYAYTSNSPAPVESELESSQRVSLIFTPSPHRPDYNSGHTWAEPALITEVTEDSYKVESQTSKVSYVIPKTSHWAIRGQMLVSIDPSPRRGDYVQLREHRIKSIEKTISELASLLVEVDQAHSLDTNEMREVLSRAECA